MGALLMLALMAIPLSEAQYAPDGTAALVRFLESSHMFRSVLEPQSDFGPTEPQEVRTCTRHAYFAVHAHEAAPDFPARIRMEPVKHSREASKRRRTEIMSLGCETRVRSRWSVRIVTALAQCVRISCTGQWPCVHMHGFHLAR
jgi:hypothetical protein